MDAATVMTERRARVAVVPGEVLRTRRGLFALMSELYPVDFEGGGLTGGDLPPADGLLLWEIPDGEADRLVVAAVGATECLLVAQPGGPDVLASSSTAPAVAGEGRVEFGTAALLDPVFRGQTLAERGVTAFPALRVRAGDELLCSLGSEPYWLARQVGQTSVSVVALGPGEMDGVNPTVYAHFNRERWLQLLPLLHFLKRISRRCGWEPPPLRACLMFDDPNLHWRTYGFLDLLAMARHARDRSYHVALAMVPLDAWYANRSATALVKQNQDQLSLCMHGNNHTRVELGVPRDDATLTRLLAQGLQRIRRFEKRTGVRVARVMVPPHGAFRESAAAPMLRLGYEAVCVSRASLRAWNREKVWDPAFGHAPVEWLHGLPVIPRQVLGHGHEGSYRLAAFLNQPIIPHGHHQDCVGGFGLLETAAAAIHGLGEVKWMDLTAISRSNYLTRRDGHQLTVKMLARRVTVPIPAWATGIVVERPWVGGRDDDHGHREEGVLFVRRRGKDSFLGNFGRRSPVLSLRFPEESLELISPAPTALDFRQVPSAGLELRTVARRLLAETRDRLLPLSPVVRRRRATTVA